MGLTQAEKAEALRALHVPGDPLVLVNAWDAASARTVAAAPGCRAIATASWAVAAAHGVPDGERLPREDLLAAIGRIAGAVELPVTADLERGYGDEPRDVALTVAGAVAAGAVGANLEDSLEGGRLREVATQVRRLKIAKGRAEADGVPLVLNGRTDTPDVDEALRRAEAYFAAGADCVYAIALRGRDAIGRFAAEAGGPVNVFAAPGGPSLAELAALGVARVSVGPGGMGVALAALQRAATTLLDRGELPGDLAFRPPA